MVVPRRAQVVRLVHLGVGGIEIRMTWVVDLDDLVVLVVENGVVVGVAHR